MVDQRTLTMIRKRELSQAGEDTGLRQAMPRSPCPHRFKQAYTLSHRLLRLGYCATLLTLAKASSSNGVNRVGVIVQALSDNMQKTASELHIKYF